MIISHEHRFIFIKTRKTAGTSVEMALARICGPQDVITPDHLHATEEDVLRPNARNFAGVFNPVPELLTASRPIDVVRTVRDLAVRPKFYNHMRAVSVKSRIEKRVWNSYFKFCFERNPWDKMISFYFWINRWNKNKQDFNDYILSENGRLTEDQKFARDWERYTHRNNIILDAVYDFADLSGGIARALAAAGVAAELAEGIHFPRLKSNLREKEDAIVYSNQSSDRISEVFAKEIKAFQYQPPAHLISANRHPATG